MNAFSRARFQAPIAAWMRSLRPALFRRPRREVRPSPTEPLAAPADHWPVAHDFLAQAARDGSRAALVDSRQILTYAQLEQCSRRLGAEILRTASSASRVVAIHGRRNAGLVVAMLGASRAGFTFAVLDAAYPPERLRQMAALIHPALIVGDDEADPRWREVFAGVNTPFLGIDSGGEVLCASAAALESPLDHAPAKIAYLLFTSGTTGKPKCIATPHAPIRHFTAWYAETFRPGVDDRFSLLSGLGHDPVLRDIFVPLSVGATLYIPDQAAITSPCALFEWVRASRISFLHGTPPLFRILCAGAQERDSRVESLRYIFSGGDQLPTKLVRQIHKAAPLAQVVNFYGATETPQAMAFHCVRHGETNIIPVGRGIRDVQLLVLTESLALAAVGERGQIGIRTRHLAAGYWEDPEATAQRFVPSPFSRDPEDRIYLTGDYGQYRPDGEVVLLGRADDQVKIRGFRVELAEVNSAVENLPLTQGAVVQAQTTAAGEKILVAYVAVDPICHDAARAELDRLLPERLPSYMLPSQVIWLDQLPLLPNGKTDRAALETLWQARQAEILRLLPADDADDNETESRLTREWCRILGMPRLDRNRSFAELGGDSISFIQASLAVRALIGHLPEDWSQISLSTLAARRAQNQCTWFPLDTAILVRALSIVLIVLGHITPYDISGAYTALFMLAGVNFANYLCPAILLENGIRPILRFLLRLAVPTLLAIAWKNWEFLPDRWWAFLMISNYLPIASCRLAGFWFMDVLFQIFAILAVLFSFRVTRRAIATDPFRFAVGATVVAMGTGMAIHLTWHPSPDIYKNWIPHRHLWTVFFGMAMLYANTWKPKLILVGLLLVGTALGVVPALSLFLACVLLYVKRVPVPAFLVPALAAIAATSLFIYVTHGQLSVLLYAKLMGASVALDPSGSIQLHSVTGLRGMALSTVLVAMGVLIGMAYNWLNVRVLRAIRSRTADEVLDGPNI